MMIAFHTSDKDREQELAKAFLAGATDLGHRGQIVPLGPRAPVPADIACMVGVKSNDLFHACKAAGQRVLYFDKGYVRTRHAGGRVWEYWRVSLDEHHPTDFLDKAKMPPDRWEALGITLSTWRRHGLQIVIAGSSAKYHAFYGIDDPGHYYSGLVDELRKLTDRPIVYRPKPSYRDARPIKGTSFSGGDESIRDALWGAHALVTHGSNACFEAALLGVPSVVLGNAVARPISSTSLADIEEPRSGKRDQWLHNLAYWQWTMDEMASGLAWRAVERWL